MKITLYLKNRSGADSTAVFDTISKEFTILKGSIISESMSASPKFRGLNSIKEQRALFVKNNIVVSDTIFKSPSTAANFVTGNSTNGLIAWKDENGIPLKKLIE